MVKIFWVTCPECQNKFYCHYKDLRHSGEKLHCPYCDNWFTEEEATNIYD